ncbi:Ubiquitin carboxyl-terminal hydrolase 12 [Morus notabilis]|uniref:ubiquitinyl hydrolase 1 n=1 Tax=Morus notabilis TaxID=981085 RepID=W9R792_9ROSA|nr:Ubiquitin carboxyl-terminal hydrolase 12 [Morus notabilis]
MCRRILIFPQGNETYSLSVYLDVADSATLPNGWSRYAHLRISVINQVHRKYTISRVTQHKFNARESDWGFTSLMPLCEFYDTARGYLVNDTCIIEAEVGFNELLDKKDSHKIIKVARNEDFVYQIGRDIYFDLVDHGKVRIFPYSCVSTHGVFVGMVRPLGCSLKVYHFMGTYMTKGHSFLPSKDCRVFRRALYITLVEEVAKELGIPVQFQRFWLWAKRQNHTYRPNRPLTPLEETQSVGQLREVSNKANNAELKLFLEVELGPDMRPVATPKKTKKEILLFFKLYDPEKEELRIIPINVPLNPWPRASKPRQRASFFSGCVPPIPRQGTSNSHAMCLQQFLCTRLHASSLLHRLLSPLPPSPSRRILSMRPYAFAYLKTIAVHAPQRPTLLTIAVSMAIRSPLSSSRCLYVGRLFVRETGMPAEILTKLNEMAGFSVDEEIELFEEIKFEPHILCEHIDKKATFRACQLEDGDIICFQKSPQVGISEQCRYPDVPSFLEYVHNRQVVRFHHLEKPEEDEFRLELSKLDTYDDVVEGVAQHLGLDDPSKIRLTSHNCDSQQPKPEPIEFRGVEHLSDMLVHYNQAFTSDILYYEILDIPLPELQGLKSLKVYFHHATKDEATIHIVQLPKQSTIGDLINDLKKKVRLSHPNAEIRLIEVFYHKIYKIFPLYEKIENINDQYWILRAEEIPEEEKNLGPRDRLIHVYHFMKDIAQNQVKQIQNFGEPFLLVIREDETLAEVKVRIQKKLRVPDDEFAKWKFAFLSLGHPEYLQDDDIVVSRFQREVVYGDWEQYLGLEHTDNAPKRSYTVNQDTTLVDAARGSCSFAEFDALFADVQNLLHRKTSAALETPSSSSVRASPRSIEEIAHAKKIFKQCLDMKLASVIQLGKTFELKNSLSTILAGNAFPYNMEDKTKNFLADFDRYCKQYMAAEQDMREAQQKEKSIDELRTTMEKLSLDFTPIRNEAEAVDREITELERELSERKAKKAKLRKNLEDLAGQATSSKQALECAEEDMRQLKLKREQAEKMVGNMERSWKSFKVGCSPLL